MVAQILGPFGVFSLILLALVWLSQSLRVVEAVVASGRNASAFLEIASLLLPTVLSMILPVAAFAATLYALNRMFMESELVVMMAAGMSRLRLARPVAAFGAGVMAAMAAITLVLTPAANREMRDRLSEIGADLAGALIREGEFIHPAEGVSVYIRAAGRDGGMAGLFVQDDRDPAARVTYTAESAALVRTEEAPRLVMFDGAAQRLDRETRALSVLRFDRLVYDLGQLMAPEGSRSLKPSEHFLPALLAPDAEMLETRTEAAFAAEAHDRLSAPLYGLALPLIALAALLGPGFRRRGYGKRLAVAVALAAGCRLAGVAAKSAATGTAALWPAIYLPPLLGVALSLLVLWKGLPALGDLVGPRRGEAAR